jgi:leucyl aminopeptidase
MEIAITQKIPAGDPGSLIVLLLPGKASDPVFLDRMEHFPESFFKKGKKHLRIFGKQPHLLIGLGDEPSIEGFRVAASQAFSEACTLGFEHILLAVAGLEKMPEAENTLTALTESLQLSAYKFGKYKTNGNEKPTVTQTSFFTALSGAEAAIKKGEKIAEAVCIARDLVNEPVITLTAEALAKAAEGFGKRYGFSVEILNKSKIKALKMGGLLAVNTGSPLPPTFTILEYKPDHPVNEKPVVLVGKGVVYDTGGLSLKPTTKSMDFMKSDMAGAAAVIGAFCGIASLGLNVHVIGLLPATDNRPGGNAYVPGDVIRMHDGSTVEVLNTDAEGRMLLADALSYAKRYDPGLVIDLATLTGAAVVAIGKAGLAMMGTASDTLKNQLKSAGERVYERLVEFPLWEEYGEQLKSDIADLSNLGGRDAGAITAGKFLEHFTDYPWIHLDIAGAAWLHSQDSYRGKNGTGTGVRLLISFLSDYRGEN